MGHNFKPATLRTAIARAKAPQKSTLEVAHASRQAARLIEAAMLNCTESDLAALDCLLEARRALSPIVDARKVAK